MMATLETHGMARRGFKPPHSFIGAPVAIQYGDATRTDWDVDGWTVHTARLRRRFPWSRWEFRLAGEAQAS
jgi:hypothetical protein